MLRAYLRIGVPPTDAANAMAIILIDTQAMSVKRTVAFHGVPSNVAWAAPDELLLRVSAE